MKILLTNDDGIGAPGLAALVKSVSELGEVFVAAPATEMSAVGHAITLSDPLKVKEYFKNGDFFGYAVTGTPADSVKIAYWVLLKDVPKPDLLISGINLGSNTGINTIYSGTVSAATEGAILGIPSFAISLATFKNPDFSVAARFAQKLIPRLLENPLPQGVFLNVNIPAVKEEEIRGVQITRQGLANYGEEYHVRTDPRNINYYWLTGEKMDIETDETVDDRAILNNYISITPIHYDLTHYESFAKLKTWNF
ncbi:5'/3'-nucleotidase SurE [candidate division KSB1 bacterium]|nr:5'/3'-nucleotidase SurE [candidate division KSB1 bacterium]